MAKKKLGFGLMRLPLVDQNEAADVDIEEMSKMVDTFWNVDLHILIQLGCIVDSKVRMLQKRLW